MTTSPYNQGSTGLATAQVTVAATATLIAAGRSGRNSVTITNTSTVAVYLGGSGVTATTGALLAGVVGATVTLQFDGPVYGIVVTGTEVVTVSEVF